MELFLRHLKPRLFSRRRFRTGCLLRLSSLKPCRCRNFRCITGCWWVWWYWVFCGLRKSSWKI